MTTAGTNGKILTANTLKVIAVCVMFFDHFASVFMPANELLCMLFKIAGRIAAPVFCFLIAEGYYYTSNLKKYILRLLIFAAVSHLPYNLAFGYTAIDSFNSFIRTFFRASGVIWSLAMGLIALAAIKSEKIHLILKLMILAACCALSYRANWNFVAVLWIVTFGVFHGNFLRQITGFCIIGIVFWLMPNFYRFGFFHHTFPQWFQPGIFLAIPLLAMYSGKQGRKSAAMKWIFYVFYPAHLILLFLLNQFTPIKEIIRGLLHI